MSIDPNAPAFPTHPDIPVDVVNGHYSSGMSGLTIRAEIASRMAQGWLASYSSDSMHPVVADCGEGFANLAVTLADHLIAELNKPQP